MRAYKRFLNYVTVWTTSDPDSHVHPSTERQFDLARQLAEEMENLGFQEVQIDEGCYVYGFLPATKGLEKAAAAAVLSARCAGTTATWDQMNKYFGLMQMPIITSQYWNMVHGTNPEEVRRDLEGMQIMRTLGNNMAYF